MYKYFILNTYYFHTIINFGFKISKKKLENFQLFKILTSEYFQISNCGLKRVMNGWCKRITFERGIKIAVWLKVKHKKSLKFISVTLSLHRAKRWKPSTSAADSRSPELRGLLRCFGRSRKSNWCIRPNFRIPNWICNRRFDSFDSKLQSKWDTFSR